MNDTERLEAAVRALERRAQAASRYARHWARWLYPAGYTDRYAADRMAREALAVADLLAAVGFDADLAPNVTAFSLRVADAVLGVQS